MCCIFTCCGWMIDLVQRLWTFTMSCCISSAVGCVMLTSSMSGIALGYNYSLAEYVDLKETNVSIYLKRGVFDDEIADDMDWRRSGHLPVAGHIGENNLRTGAPADDDVSTTLRSGRRLDDSMFESSDQNSYEGSLMRLTAKPPYQDTEGPRVTEDLQIAEAASRYPMGSLDQMKAIQSLIDSRRAMAAVGGTTNSPVATYGSHEGLVPYLPFNNNPNEPGNRDAQFRRLMDPRLGMKPPNINPARYAVPEVNLGSRNNWVIPKKPELFPAENLPEYFVFSPTYPPAVTVAPGLVRPGSPVTVRDEEKELKGGGPVVFPTRTTSTVKPTKKSAIMEKLDKESEAFNERFLLEGDVPSKNDFIKLPNIGHKSSEEEYEDEIKGLPVRKRRSVKNKFRNGHVTYSTKTNKSIPFDNASERNNGTTHILMNIITSSTWIGGGQINNNNKSNIAKNKIKNVVEENDSKIDSEAVEVDQQMDKNEQSNLEQNNKSIFRQNLSEKKPLPPEKIFLSRLITSVEIKKTTLEAETTAKVDFVTITKKIKIKRKPFESKIVSSNYEPNYKSTMRVGAKEDTLSNQEILNSISVNLNEAGLLRNPASSTFVKLLQSTLT